MVDEPFRPGLWSLVAETASSSRPSYGTQAGPATRVTLAEPSRKAGRPAVLFHTGAAAVERPSRPVRRPARMGWRRPDSTGRRLAKRESGPPAERVSVWRSLQQLCSTELGLRPSSSNSTRLSRRLAELRRGGGLRVPERKPGRRGPQRHDERIALDPPGCSGRSTFNGDDRVGAWRAGCHDPAHGERCVLS